MTTAMLTLLHPQRSRRNREYRIVAIRTEDRSDTAHTIILETPSTLKATLNPPDMLLYPGPPHEWLDNLLGEANRDDRVLVYRRVTDPFPTLQNPRAYAVWIRENWLGSRDVIPNLEVQTPYSTPALVGAWLSLPPRGTVKLTGPEYNQIAWHVPDRPGFSRRERQRPRITIEVGGYEFPVEIEPGAPEGSVTATRRLLPEGGEAAMRAAMDAMATMKLRVLRTGQGMQAATGSVSDLKFRLDATRHLLSRKATEAAEKIEQQEAEELERRDKEARRLQTRSDAIELD